MKGKRFVRKPETGNRFLRAQTSVEFLIVFSGLLVLFMIFFIVYFGENVNLLQKNEQLLATSDSYALASAINYVHLAGDGAWMNYSLGLTPGDENITISRAAVETSGKRTLSQAPILNSRVNESLISSTNIVIKNIDGEIVIEQ